MANYYERWQRHTMFSIVYGVDDEAVLPDPVAPTFEDSLHTLYHALVDALTPPEPREIAQRSQVSAWMMQWGAPDIGRELGRGVQRYRDGAKAGAVATLRAALMKIERERAGEPAQELGQVA